MVHLSQVILREHTKYSIVPWCENACARSCAGKARALVVVVAGRQKVRRMCITCTVRIMPHLFCDACHETHTPCDYGTVVLFVAKLGMHHKRFLLAVQRYCGQLEADSRVVPINCDTGSPFLGKF